MHFLQSKKFLSWSIVGMRVALGIIFLWFGLLKLSGRNPVFEIVNATFPMLASGAGNYVLAVFEVLIGLALILNIFAKIAHIALLLHLAGTFATFFIAPQIMFGPYFPFLNINGEFVVKNLALAIGGLIVLSHHAQNNASGK